MTRSTDLPHIDTCQARTPRQALRAAAAALAVALTLAACGGGATGTGTSTGSSSNPGPVPTAAQLTLLPLSAAAPGDFIAPLDTASLQRSAVAKAKAQPVSRLPAGASVAHVALGQAPAPKSTRAGLGVPLQIGRGRDVLATATPAGLAGLWRWHGLPDGGQVAAVRFETGGAQGVRLGVLARDVPDGTVLRFYGDAAGPVVEMNAAELAALREVNQRAGLDGDAAATAWGPDTDGAVSTLEVQLPAGVSVDRLQLAVPRLSHLDLSVAQAADISPKDTAELGAAGNCNVDVMCTPYQTEGRAVAKMVFSTLGDTYLCSGTLLNDTRGSQTPYFLTAAHCVADQQTASTLITYWFFRAAGCNSSPRVDAAYSALAGGAQLLYTRAAFDATLLRLNRPPPDNVVYAGSYFGPGVGPGTDVLAAHHPSGDLQKISVGSVSGYANCGGSDACVSGATEASAAMLQVRWRHGVTEGGSSGGALFARSGNTRYLVGQLYGGAASCFNPGGTDYFGRFQRSFADGIGRWLTR